MKKIRQIIKNGIVCTLFLLLAIILQFVFIPEEFIFFPEYSGPPEAKMTYLDKSNCVEEYTCLHLGGFPFRHIQDREATSVVGSLGLEDHIYPTKFFGNVLFYFYILVQIKWGVKKLRKKYSSLSNI